MKKKDIRKAIFLAGGILGWIVLLWIGGCGVLPHLIARTVPDKEVIRVTSPDGKHDAVGVYHYTPPLTSGRAMISIVPVGQPHDPKQVVFGAHGLHWTTARWPAPHHLMITRPARDSVLHFEPVWPRHPHVVLNGTADTIRITLEIEHGEALNNALHGTAESRADAAPSVP